MLWARDKSSHFYFADGKPRSTGDPNRWAFWYGYTNDKKPRVISKRSSEYAFWRAGQDFRKEQQS
jgi:hypothetical protein